ncbi:outer membrane protein [Tenacibaculum piscium]|uniref:outer membrane protein n=1 Tax=Tenacibaculum piscium TaxID=1458515 RepID=UPI001F243308|nr:outer membrane beta-barrel protein [Tenacibaculum piscium]MCG8183905.1 outer membrane beta-barrel protein [Tenacibaculum piscium]MCG8205169.1 outer membrane beta-barrel protein [Tenacibaculum piscium]
MKTTTLFIAIFTTLLAVFSTTKTQAQTKDGTFLAGAGIGYASEINSLGLSAKGVYIINEQWEAAASFTYFLPKKTYGFDLKWYSFDVDAHYVFSSKDKTTFYGLAGINALMVNVPTFDFEGDYDDIYDDISDDSQNIYEEYNKDYNKNYNAKETSSTTTDFGVNIGAGARYEISKSISLVGEAKYTITTGGFFQIGAGVLFAF